MSLPSTSEWLCLSNAKFVLWEAILTWWLQRRTTQARKAQMFIWSIVLDNCSLTVFACLVAMLGWSSTLARTDELVWQLLCKCNDDWHMPSSHSSYWTYHGERRRISFRWTPWWWHESQRPDWDMLRLLQIANQQQSSWISIRSCKELHVSRLSDEWRPIEIVLDGPYASWSRPQAVRWSPSWHLSSFLLREMTRTLDVYGSSLESWPTTSNLTIVWCSCYNQHGSKWT